MVLDFKVKVNTNFSIEDILSCETENIFFCYIVRKYELKGFTRIKGYIKNLLKVEKIGVRVRV